MASEEPTRYVYIGNPEQMFSLIPAGQEQNTVSLERFPTADSIDEALGHTPSVIIVEPFRHVRREFDEFYRALREIHQNIPLIVLSGLYTLHNGLDAHVLKDQSVSYQLPPKCSFEAVEYSYSLPGGIVGLREGVYFVDKMREYGLSLGDVKLISGGYPLEGLVLFERKEIQPLANMFPQILQMGHEKYDDLVAKMGLAAATLPDVTLAGDKLVAGHVETPTQLTTTSLFRLLASDIMASYRAIDRAKKKHRCGY